VDAAHRETAASANQERGAVFESSTHPVVPERPDPYEAHRKDLARGGIHTEPSIAAMTALDPANKKARQARAQLDRPLTPPRFGKLGDRDRYGQKLSLRGWCTDED
jgi:hypothetical protein